VLENFPYEYILEELYFDVRISVRDASFLLKMPFLKVLTLIDVTPEIGKVINTSPFRLEYLISRSEFSETRHYGQREYHYEVEFFSEFAERSKDTLKCWEIGIRTFPNSPLISEALMKLRVLKELEIHERFLNAVGGIQAMKHLSITLEKLTLAQDTHGVASEYDFIRFLELEFPHLKDITILPRLHQYSNPEAQISLLSKFIKRHSSTLSRLILRVEGIALLRDILAHCQNLEFLVCSSEKLRNAYEVQPYMHFQESSIKFDHQSNHLKWEEFVSIFKDKSCLPQKLKYIEVGGEEYGIIMDESTLSYLNERYTGVTMLINVKEE